MHKFVKTFKSKFSGNTDGKEGKVKSKKSVASPLTVAAPSQMPVNNDRKSDDKNSPRPVRSDLLKLIPTFQDSTTTNRPNLFLTKLRLCSVMFDWNEESSPLENRAKEVKRQQLLELVEYIGKNKNIYNDQVLVEIIKMVQANLFRSLPPRVNDNPVDAEEDEPVFEPSWPHLQIVYEFFFAFYCLW